MCILLAKNLISYTRLEILIYVALPLLMLHLVILRCWGTYENDSYCSAPGNRSIADTVPLNFLFNSLEKFGKPAPSKKLLLFTNDDSVADTLKPKLLHSLKLNGVIRVKKEGDMEKNLVNNNYLAGILWKVQGPNTTVTIRFPSVLRTWPTHLWDTEKRIADANLPSYYFDEGFMTIMDAIIAYLVQPGLANSSPVNKGTPNVIKQHVNDNITKIDPDRLVFDPITWSREFFMIFYLGLLYIFPFIRLVMHMTREKTRQQVDLMNIAGSNRFLHYLSWFLTTFCILTLLNLMTIFILKAPLCENGNVLNCSSFTALLFLFTIWSLCGICFCFLVYSLVNSFTFAAFVVAFLCVLALLLFAIIPETILSLCVLFHYGFLTVLKQILELESRDNTGLQWDNLFYNNPDLRNINKDSYSSSSVNVGAVLGIMIAVAIVSLIIALVAELICPGRYGMSKLNSTLYDRRSECDDTSMIVQTNNLHKLQWNKPPLNHFTMNMYDDQITVLLGRPDSGKSTVLNLISRSFSPDSGYVKIDNMDTRSNLRRINLGLAPQHNALYPNLTVLEHTVFYSSLRRSPWGLKSGRLSMENYLRAVDLWNVRHVKSRNLTRADKKKLAVVNAFCGNPRIVLLDEPTEGLEPCEKRLVWDLLRDEKLCRTIIMTTYHIDEADTLADRVGILCEGQLIFNGSSEFLKNCYGSGYQLVCSHAQDPRIKLLVAKYIPNTIVSSDRDCEISYNIPQSSRCGIGPLLRALEKPVPCVNTNTLQIGTTPIVEKYLNATAPVCVDVNSSCTNICMLPEPPECLLNGWRLCCNQWKAMTLKKFLHIRHNCLLFLLLPLLLAMAFAGLLAYYLYNKPPHIPKYHNCAARKWVSQDKLKLDLDSYPKPCFFSLMTQSADHPLKEVVRQLNQTKGCNLEWSRPPLNDKHIYTLSMTKCNYQSYYSRKWIHSEGAAAAMIAYLAYTKLMDKICFDLDPAPDMPKGDIEFYNHPYPAMLDNKNSTAYKAECQEGDLLNLMLLCISIFTGFFTAFIIRERILGFKLMQKVEGINMATFWLAHLLWDWLWLTLFSVVLVALMSVILKKGFSEAIAAYIIALMFFNLAWLAFLYLVMQVCKCTLFGWIIPIFLTIFMVVLFKLVLPLAILYLIPVYTALAMLHRICQEEDWRRLCNEKIRSSYRDCGEEAPWSIFKAILPYLAILMALAILYFALLLLYERGLPCRRKRCCDGMGRCQRQNHILLLDNVKSDSCRSPVRDISFGLKCMDVLGLVGERSGKTTLNKLIISQHRLSRGCVYVRDIHLEAKRDRYRAYKCIGYCPQKNSFEPRFTGRENLTIFALIRGIGYKQTRKVTHELADNLSFRCQLDKRAKWYSVSDKRKLSTAIAVLGTPPLIILDQPTDGVEKPHQLNVLHFLKSVNDCGSAILLSSNSIEDFQYLCNRLALIRRGKLVAIGPVSSYRNHASRGLILMVKARPHALVHQLCIYSINSEAIINIITRFLLANFGCVYLLEEIQGDMLFYIHNSSIPLSKAFHIIDKNRFELCISDFYIKHEDIELSFVTRNFRILR